MSDKCMNVKKKSNITVNAFFVCALGTNAQSFLFLIVYFYKILLNYKCLHFIQFLFGALKGLVHPNI